MNQGDDNSLGYRVGKALEYKPSKQPVANAGKVGEKPEEATKQREVAGGAGFTQRQKGTPNRSYPVEIVNKLIAKIGGF